MLVHVLLYDSGTDSEGIHSLELKGNTVVLMFENKDDADRYTGLLEAQDFPKPSVEALQREQIEQFCLEADYEARFVPAGFVPQSEEDRLLLSPPEANKDVSSWEQQNLADENSKISQSSSDYGSAKLEEIRNRLEELL